MKQTLFILLVFSFLLCGCNNETTKPTENLYTPTLEETIEPTIFEPTVDVTTEVTPTPEVPKTEEVVVPKLIIIYLDIDWEEITEVYFNDLPMVYGPYDNDCEFKIEIESDSISKLDLDFKQYNSWWHVQDEYMSWNTESVLEVDMKVGETYIVSEVNWTYQWDNEEQKWYTCTITKVE